MRWPFITRRTHAQELAAVNTDRERLRNERDQFKKDRDAAQTAARTAARQFADADTAGRRLAGRNQALSERLAALNATVSESAGGLEQQLTAVRTELAAETRRADGLQARLDDYLGLNSPAVARGQNWQADRQDKRSEVKP